MYLSGGKMNNTTGGQMMNANEMTFGVEIECLIPVANAPECGHYHHGRQIADLPAGWNAQRDGSIRAGRGYVGVEVVSGILQGADGVGQVKAVCEWLKRIGARVNKSTGLHIHVGVEHSPEALKKIVTVAANFEKAIYASTGTKARERGTYCRSVQNSRQHITGELGSVSRYHVLNVSTGHPTVEFRAFAGTINFVKILTYVRMSLAIVEKSLEMKKLPQWTAKPVVETSPIARGGEGLTALNRLFYWMGWTKGRTDKVYGNIGDTSIKTGKNQLIRLAKKYDAAR
jgi:hypothetical protein